MKYNAMKHYKFGSKDVYVFTDHSVALKAWTQITRGMECSPILLSLDHHTDCHEPFLSHACAAAGGRIDDMTGWVAVANQCLKEVDLNDDASIDRALQKLKNDEQIRTAIELGVFDAAFVLCYSDSGTPSREVKAVYHQPISAFFAKPSDVPPRPHTYDIPDGRIFCLPNLCFVGCCATPHTDDCTRPHADQAIESVLLTERLSHADEMIKAFGKNTFRAEPYVLDIDLDYFMTKASLEPGDTSVFDDLARNSIAITIAREPHYVELVKLDSDLNADFSLAALFRHLERALGPHELAMD